MQVFFLLRFNFDFDFDVYFLFHFAIGSIDCECTNFL